MNDEDNQGQNETFTKNDYEFVMKNSYRVKFKPAYRKKKGAAFGRLQTRRNRNEGKKTKALKTIKEDKKEEEK